jgi:hypothetical protein
MSKQRKQEPEPTIVLRLWTYAEAVKALPYLRAIVRSLRDHWLELQQARQQIRRMDARPGRRDRQALLVRTEAGREVELAEERYEETLRELMALDVICHDPAKGLALIPFHQGEELAWFVFDLFAPRGLEAWRFHADPLEMRRPLGEQLDTALVDAIFSSRSFDVSVFGAEQP